MRFSVPGGSFGKKIVFMPTLGDGDGFDFSGDLISAGDEGALENAADTSNLQDIDSLNADLFPDPSSSIAVDTSTGSSFFSGINAGDVAKFGSTLVQDIGDIEVGQALRQSLAPGATSNTLGAVLGSLFGILEEPIVWIGIGAIFLITHMSKSPPPARAPATRKKRRST